MRWGGPADEPKQERLWLLHGFLTADEALRTKWDEATTDLARINETVQEDIAHNIIQTDLKSFMKASKIGKNNFSDLKKAETTKDNDIEDKYKQE